jgi:hypothetical protein
MAFRIRTTEKSPEKILKRSQPEQIYTEEQIQLITEKYEKYENKQPDQSVSSYKKSLKKEPEFVKETIIYNKNTKIWEISKETEK